MRTSGWVALGLWSALALSAPAWGQAVGHKLPGTLGLNAGMQPEPGLYAANQLVAYDSDTLRDRNGNIVATDGFALRVVANNLGLQYTLQTGGTYVNFAASIPGADVNLSSSLPQASIDKYGLSDARVQPFGVGLRQGRLDVVTAYALYIPTGRVEPGGTPGLSRGSFSHEVSLGGTLFFDRRHVAYLTALSSFELNMPKIGIDLRPKARRHPLQLREEELPLRQVAAPHARKPHEVERVRVLVARLHVGLEQAQRLLERAAGAEQV
jgi:hypothetical protein